MNTEKTVLVLDADEDGRIVVRLALEHYGYSVLEAESSQDAIALIRSAAPQLILTEIDLIPVDGLELVRTLKAESSTADIPVIALTVYTLPEDRGRCLRAGCDSYVAKPFNFRRVIAEVERFIGQPQEPRFP